MGGGFLVRLFVAIEIGEAVRARLERVLPSLRSIAPSARFVPAQNLHVTLAFLGASPEEDLEGICGALDLAASAHPPLSLMVGGGGAFGTRAHPRVLWVGVEGDLLQLSALFGDLEDQLEVFGYEREKRPFHPHVTLARARELRGDPTLAECAARLSSLELMPIHVSELVLMKSTPGPGGSRYEALHHAPLTGGASAFAG